MADNVAITAGSGTTIATDDISGVHYQRVKLVDGTLDGTGAIGGDATNGLDVDVTRQDAWRIPAETTMQNAASSTGNGTSMTVTGYGMAMLQVTGTFTATITVEGTRDSGTTWIQCSVSQVGGTELYDTITAPGVYRALIAGFDSVRARVTWTSGTSVTVVGRATNAPYVARTIRAIGNVAHDAVDSGAPVKIGARSVAALSTATMVAAGDRTDVVADVDGVVITRAERPLGDTLIERVTDTGGTSTALTTFGATANARNCIDAITVYNDSTTAGFVDIRDGSAGSVIWTIPLPPKGGAHITFPRPLRQPTANTALAYDVSGALTTVYLSFLGFKSKA